MFALVFPFLFTAALSVEINPQNEPAEFLWELYNLAIQRQTHNHYPFPYTYKYPGKYPEYYQNYPHNQYPGSKYLASQKKYPYSYKVPNTNTHQPIHPYGHRGDPNTISNYIGGLQTFSKPKESIMDVLYSIARNDDLQCVPKLICEVTSGTISGRQQGINLPVNINMESIIGFLSALNGAQSSPILHFGKAALLGFASKGNTASCNYAYPDCPADPDKVLKYLNNHNGGFFRFFNGVYPQPPQNYQQIPHFRKAVAEERIQNSVVNYNPSNNFQYQSSVAFPKEEEFAQNFDSSHRFRTEKGLRFPSRDIPTNELNQNYDTLKFPVYDNYEAPFRKPKELFNYYPEYNLDLQRPLPNHKPTPMIFPVRTGTGDLRLDPEELQDYRRPVAYEDDNVRVIFNEVNSDGINPDEYYNRDGRGFSFPSR